jgi:hypothetical protein
VTGLTLPGVFLYFKGCMTEAGWLQVDKNLRHIPGVVAPWQSPNVHQIVLVYYNPALMRASEIIKHVRGFGYDACVIDL